MANQSGDKTADFVIFLKFLEIYFPQTWRIVLIFEIQKKILVRSERNSTSSVRMLHWQVLGRLTLPRHIETHETQLGLETH